jgi:hypothetical protein
LILDLVRKCFLPTAERPSCRELMNHPFFRQGFESKAAPVSGDRDGIVVLFGPAATSDDKN